MPVSNPGTPSLAGNYANIQAALEQSAQIAGKDTGTMGAVAAAAAPVAERAKKVQDVSDQAGLAAYKASLEDQINQHQTQYTAVANGRAPYTQDDVANLFKQHGLPPEAAPKFKGTVNLSEADQHSMVEQAEYDASTAKAAATIKDPNRKALFEVVAHDKNNTAILPRIMGMGEIELRINPQDSLNHIYDRYSGQDYGPAPTSVTADASGKPQPTNYQDLPPVPRKAVQKVIDESSKDPEISKTTSKLDALNDIRDAVKSNNPTAITNIRARLAETIGEVPGGRMSTGLLAQEGFSKAAMNRFDQAVQTFEEGTLTPDNQKFLLDQIDSAQQGFTKRLSTKVSSYTDAITQASGNRLAPDAAVKAVSTKVQPYLDQAVQRKAVAFLQKNGKATTQKNIDFVIQHKLATGE